MQSLEASLYSLDDPVLIIPTSHQSCLIRHFFSSELLDGEGPKGRL